ncbi:MAG: 30S ribosomal protein S2 [Alphaproteobacteria bacterium]|nr:MAG: 30S ribosomal protein S2 [Alphaproteobacteria bacterium]
MALPDFSMRQLLEAGVHFGHQTHRWNPKMAKYIFGDRSNIHIIDLAQTVPMLHRALQAISDTVAGGGRVLFVGTKRQASEPIAESARRSAQYYVNARWLGGMLTNWKTISNSIKRLKTLEEMLEGDVHGFTKKERLSLTREMNKLERALGGIKDMGGLPSMLFVIDTNKEAIAINEARRLKIPVAAILDTNCDPDDITYPIPGNDDAGRAVVLFCDLVARAALDGISRSQADLGVDLGAAEEVPTEAALAAEPAAVVLDVTGEPETETTPEPEAAAVPEPEPAAETAPESEVAPEAGAEPEAAPEPEAAAEPEAVAEPEAAPEKQPEAVQPLFTAPEGDPDDLKKISGVGPVLEGKLHGLGITRLSQIAAFTAEDIDRVDDALAFKGRIGRDDWVAQARTLMAETEKTA